MSQNDPGYESEGRVLRALSELAQGMMDGTIDPAPLPPVVQDHLRTASAAQLRAVAVAALLALLEAEPGGHGAQWPSDQGAQ